MVKLQSADCGLSVMLQSGRIARVDIDQGDYRTAEGIGIGSSEDELSRAYGAGLKSVPNRYTRGAKDIIVEKVVSGQRRSILFYVENGEVRSFRAGDAAAVALVEHCL